MSSSLRTLARVYFLPSAFGNPFGALAVPDPHRRVEHVGFLRRQTRPFGSKSREKQAVSLGHLEDRAEHWDGVFEAKSPDRASWFQAEPVTSVRLLNRWASPEGSLIDVGAGASTLVESMLDLGWSDMTLLDISQAALKMVENRLGGRSNAVNFVAADVRSWQPSRTFGAWHDRAVFHFLVEPAERDHYVAIAGQAVEPGGVAVMATFAADGPTECSGLPTSRYDIEELGRIFDPLFELEHAERESHSTPFGTMQPFTWVVLRRRNGRGS
jgi:2-polyprenyl-3-methyl-5-hydroxy-6-metoxy-1,4-benzoquinol methylase